MRISNRNNSFLRTITFLMFTILFLLLGIDSVRYIFATFFFALTILSFFYKSGLEIDKNMRFRNYKSFLGYSFGKWKRLPEFDYISVVRVNQSRWNATGGYLGQKSSANKSYNVNFIMKNNYPKNIKLISTTKTKALDYALEIGNLLNSRVVDYTDSNYKWIR